MKNIHTENAPNAIGPYSQGKEALGLIFTSGQIAILPESGNLASDDIIGQTHQAIKNLAAVLQAADSDLSAVLKTTCYLKNMDDFAAFNQVYAQYFPQKPARSCVEVARLPKNALVEIEAIAEKE